MRERVSPLHLLRNLQQQAEQVPHLSQMARETLERLTQPGAMAKPAEPAKTVEWPARLLGALLVAGAAAQGLAPTAETWPSWLMLAGGLYLVLRR
jgi:ubiquinone biosynthesis protein